jgi:drug/metabolite transporter (DMT)-like permease
VALAFSTWAYALKHSTAGKLGVTTFVVPPMTILMGWLILGEVPLAILGGALSLVGVAIASRPSKPRATVPSGM